MRHFTMQVIEKLPVSNAASIPAPFPGKWPTHIAFNIYERRTNKLVHTYIGKPGKFAVDKLSHAYTYNYYEFDRRTVIRSNMHHDVDMELWNFYHHGIQPCNITGWWGLFYKDRVKIGKYRVYRHAGMTTNGLIGNLKIIYQERLGL